MSRSSRKLKQLKHKLRNGRQRHGIRRVARLQVRGRQNCAAGDRTAQQQECSKVSKVRKVHQLQPISNVKAVPTKLAAKVSTIFCCQASGLVQQAVVHAAQAGCLFCMLGSDWQHVSFVIRHQQQCAIPSGCAYRPPGCSMQDAKASKRYPCNSYLARSHPTRIYDVWR